MKMCSRVIIGIGMSGPTLSGVVLIILQQMVEQLGWRSTIYIVGAVLAAVIFPLAWFVVRDTPQEMGMLPDGDPSPAPIDAVMSAAIRHPGLFFVVSRRQVPTRMMWVSSGTMSCPGRTFVQTPMSTRSSRTIQRR